MVETLILAVIGLWSIVVVLGKLLPNQRRQSLMWLAQWCQQRGYGRIAAWLSPAESGGCDSGCSSCASRCSTPTPLTTARETEIQAVKWHSPKSPH